MTDAPNLLDLLVVLAIVPAAVGGYRLGFLARAFSWVGLVIGLVVAARVLPGVVGVAEGLSSPGRFAVAAAVLVGGALAGQALGLVVGAELRPRKGYGPARLLDGVGGAVAGGLGVLAATWLLLPALADVRGDPARLARTSAVASLIDRYAPAPPDTLHALSRLVGDRRFPDVFDALQPAPSLGPPPADPGLAPGVVDAARASVVRVQGDACGRTQEGSGFVAEPGLVVTNAHVVAGERRPRAVTLDGERLRADVVLFDPDRDLALLSVPGLGLPALPIGEAEVGALGAVFGFPGGGALELSPYRVSEQLEAVGRDLYGEDRSTRSVLVLAAELAPGDSGGALVDGDGEVAGVAFAIAPDRPGTAYALSIGELEAALSADRVAGTSTGPCLS